MRAPVLGPSKANEVADGSGIVKDFEFSVRGDGLG